MFNALMSNLLLLIMSITRCSVCSLTIAPFAWLSFSICIILSSGYVVSIGTYIAPAVKTPKLARRNHSERGTIKATLSCLAIFSECSLFAISFAMYAPSPCV